MTDRTFLLLGAIAAMATAFDKLSDDCYAKGGKWWQGKDCGGTHNTECSCASCVPCETSMLKIEGVDWNSKCSIARNDPRVAGPSWPKFEYDTAFSRTDPNRDAEWIHKIRVAAQEESNGPATEIYAWALAIGSEFIGGNPLMALLPFAVEKTMDYLEVGVEEKEDQVIDLDLADTVDRILEMTADIGDQDDLADHLNTVQLAMRAAHDQLKFIVDDVSIKSSLETVVANEKDLNSKFVETFANLELLETRPQAAWYLYEPMFALMDQQFQHVLLEFALKWAQASGAKRTDDPAGAHPHLIAHEDRITECENLDEYLNGPVINGARDTDNTATLIYKWDLFVEYFEMAWEARMATITQNLVVTRTVNKKVEKWDFGNDFCGRGGRSLNKGNHLSWNQGGCKWAELDSDLKSTSTWKDTWQWGSKRDQAAIYETTWRANSNFEYCHHAFGQNYNAALCCNKCSSHANRWAGPIPNGGKCSMSYSGQRLGDAHGPGNYRSEALAKKEELFEKYEAAYNEMRHTIEKTLASCRAFNHKYEIEQLQATMAVPNGPVETDILKFTNNCMLVQSWNDVAKCPDDYSAIGDLFWTTHQNTNMNGLFSNLSDEDSRCPFRFSDLNSAKAACKRYAECFGVTKDNGLCGGKRYELRGRGSDGSLYGWSGVTTYKKHILPKAQSGVVCSEARIDSFTSFDFEKTAQMCAEKCAANHRCKAFDVKDANAKGRMDLCSLYERCTTRPGQQARSVPRVFRMSTSTGDVVCRKDSVNGRREFKLAGQGNASFMVDGEMVTTRGIFGYGKNEEYDIEIWRHTDPWNNPAYTGSNKWLPVAQGKFKFTSVKTLNYGNMVRADPIGDLYTFLSQDGKDSGELHQSSTIPGGFTREDRVCLIPAVSSSSAARAAEQRLGAYENEDGTCTYSVSVTAHSYAGPWSFEYNGACAGVTFDVVNKDEKDVASGLGGRCGTRFNLKEGLVQVQDNGQTIDWKPLTCANQGFSITSERVVPAARRRIRELPAAAPSNLDLKRFTL